MNKSKELKNITDRRAYRLLTTINQDPYDEECWSTHRVGGVFKWKKKVLYKFQYRMYRTWKYNRKTKWK